MAQVNARQATVLYLPAMTKIRPRAPKLASQMANNIEMRRLDYWKFAEMSDCMFLLLDKLNSHSRGALNPIKRDEWIRLSCSPPTRRSVS